MLVKMETGASGGGGQVVTNGYSATYPSNGKVTCGFKPKYVLLTYYFNSTSGMTIIYDETVSTTQVRRFYDWADKGMSNMSNATNGIASIDDDGFSLSSYSGTRSATCICWAAYA